MAENDHATIQLCVPCSDL